MASVRKREWEHKGVKKTAWQVTYTDPATGRRPSKQFDKKKDADAYRLKVETEIEAGTHVSPAQSPKVEEASRIFLMHCQTRRQNGTLTGNGYVNYERNMRRVIVGRFGHLKVSEITPAMCEEAVRDWASEFSAWTVKAYVGTLKVFLDFSVKKRWVKISPMAAAELEMPATKKRKAVPTKSDLMALLEASSERIEREEVLSFINRRVAIVLGVFAGLRPGETFGLQWEDIDLERGVLDIKHSYSLHDGLKAPKSDAGNRKIPISAPILDALKQVAAYRKAVEAANGPGHNSYSRQAINWRIQSRWESYLADVDMKGLSGYVIQTAHGGSRKSISTTKGFWWRVMKKAGLFDYEANRPKFTMHAMRHAAASLFIEAGLRPFNLSSVMGHSSVAITYNVYGHLFPEDESLVLATKSIAEQFSARQESDIAA